MPNPVSLLPACLWIALAAAPRAQNHDGAPDDGLAKLGIDAEAAALFAKVEPEFLRYQKLAIYGNTLASTQPAKELVDAEVELYQKRKAAGKLQKPDRTDAVLCFNLLLQRPAIGREYLTAIVAGTTPGQDPLVDNAIHLGATAAEQWGERFAVAGLAGKDVAWRRFWAAWLSRGAIEDATAPALRSAVAAESDAETRASLYRALGTLVDAKAVPVIEAGLAKEREPKVRAAMVFAVVEIRGRDALPWLARLEDPSDEVKAEIKDGGDYLRDGTTDANKHGFEIGNDREFAQRFGDLHTPAIDWLQKEGLLADDAIDGTIQLDEKRKAALFQALEQSLGFGLEAVKGSLFASLTKEDLPQLRRLRALSVYSPNALTPGRCNTLLIMIRSLRAPR